MSFERINPVALISGAGGGEAIACLRALAPRADGGLILADASEAGLDASADALHRPPERVSTLAFDPRAQGEWKRAIDFIAAHYGRLDWLAINTRAPLPRSGKLALADLDAALLAFRAGLRLLRENVQGGAAVFVVDARAAMKANLQQVLRVAAKEGAVARTRVNAIVCGGDAPAWRGAPAMPHVNRAALERLAKSNAPIARCIGYDVEWLLPYALSDETPLTGAILVVDETRAL
jgi:NAD(P)-dependent dehydrogenase (short-subunit alcohol dehydrogenase family)